MNDENIENLNANLSPNKAFMECPFETKNDFDDFLVNLSINYSADYKLVDTRKEALRAISDILVSTIDSKYKSEIGIFDTKT